MISDSLRRYISALPLLLAPLAAAAQFVPTSPVSGLVNRTVMTGEELQVDVTEFDKCGPISEKGRLAYAAAMAAGLGYYYADLLEDIDRWEESPHVVATTSIGRTVEGRDIWELTITDPEGDRSGRHRVTIHARTHPHEIQSWWVVEEMIAFLLSDDPYAALLRETIVFHIYPMYNPDGVEANSTRYNANGIDLEREWDKKEPQPEAAALKARFAELMASEQPIEVALNLHSSSDPERYFWYHAATGTSEEFALLEQQFIAGVRAFFDRIMPWDYAVSWNGIAPTHFPESWFWYNFGADVMALTYEEVFSHTLETPDADFDSAAVALLHGVGDYLKVQPASVLDPRQQLAGMSATVVSPGTIRLSVDSPIHRHLRLYDRLGRLMVDFGRKTWHTGEHELAIESDLSTGIYYLFGTGARATPLVVR